MESIPHRELRNNSSAVLARVRAGESLAVTNHGVVTAILSPPGSCEFARLELAGQVREPRIAAPDFTKIRRARSSTSSQELLDDLRGDR